MHCVKVGCEASVSEENAVSLLGIKVQWDKYTRVHSESLEHRKLPEPGLGQWDS
jgi:hypothetical protein